MDRMKLLLNRAMQHEITRLKGIKKLESCDDDCYGVTHTRSCKRNKTEHDLNVLRFMKSNMTQVDDTIVI